MKQSYHFLFIFFLICFTSKLYSQSVPSYVPTNGLVGWWGFNGNAQDGSGNGNHVLNNNCGFTFDRFGQNNSAVDLVGPNKWLGGSSTLGQPIISLGPVATVNIWVKIINNSFGEIYHEGGGGNPKGFGLLISGGSSGLLGTRLTVLDNGVSGNVTGISQGGGYNLGLSQWVNVTLVKNGNSVLLYINGTFNSSGVLSFTSLTSGWLNFGVPDIGEGNLDCHLDDIGIWNRALTQQEITNLYNAQNPQPCTTSITNNINISGCGFAVLSSGDTVNQSGTYIDTLLNSLGCDSILNQLVTIQNPSTCNPVPSYVPTNGLVGWWGFNGNSLDGSGNGNHGTVNGATLTTDRFGLIANAYYLNGVSDYLSVPVLNNSLLPQNLTVSTWCQIPSNYTANNHIGMMVRSRFFGYILLYDDNNQSIRFETFTNGTATPTGCASNGTDYSDNVWHHIVGTFDGSINKLYIDGNLISSIISTHPISYSSDGIIAFGRDGNNPSLSTALYQGKLDDIGIWNRALTQQEITNLYNSQLPTQTSLCLPTITTNTPTSIGIDSVVIGGDILNDGGSFIVLRGVCYSTTPNPNMGNPRTEEGSGIGSFTTTLRNLSPSTTYYARSYAKNSQGVVVYGNEVSFSTGTPIPSFSCGTSTVSDVDGNNYNTVQIGNQCWTQSNLKVSKYRNGDTIPTGLNNSLWASTTVGAYAIYNSDPVNDGLYGKLYNHYAVMDARGLCPTGWHIPTDGEWNILVKYLDADADTVCNNCWQSAFAGVALKSTSGWAFGNGYNSSGFTALPGGLRDEGGGFNVLGDYGFWWSSSSSWSNAWRRTLTYSIGAIYRNDSFRNYGVSVRCLRD